MRGGAKEWCNNTVLQEWVRDSCSEKNLSDCMRMFCALFALLAHSSDILHGVHVQALLLLGALLWSGSFAWGGVCC